MVIKKEASSMKKRMRIIFNAPLVLCFATACFAVTLAGTFTGETSTARLFATYRTSFSDPMMYVRLFTHVLVHAGFIHLVNNMAYILLLGPGIEEKYGSRNLLLVILTTAAITGLVHNLLFPASALLGASGIVFAFILLTSFTEFREGEIPLTFILVAAIYLGQQIWDGITVRDNVSNLTHIIGGLIGGSAGYLLNRRTVKNRGR